MNKRKRDIAMLLLAFLLSVALVIPRAEPVDAATPRLNKTKVTLVKGRQVKLKVAGTTKKVKWSSDKKKIATVTSKGVVKAKGKGTAKIIAKIGKKKLICWVTVEAPKLSKTGLTLGVGKMATLKLIGTKSKVKWYTTDRNIATVTQKGVVRSVRVGECRVYARVNGGRFYCIINVENRNVFPSIPLSTITPTPTETITDYDEALARKSLSYEYYEDSQKINIKVNNEYKYTLSVDILCVFYDSKGSKVATIRRRFSAIPSRKSCMHDIEYPRYSNNQIKEYERFEIIYDRVSLQTDYRDRMVSCAYELKEDYLQYTLQNNLGKNTEEFGIVIAFYKEGKLVGHCNPEMCVLDTDEALTDRVDYATINGEKPDSVEIMIPMIHKNQISF